MLPTMQASPGPLFAINNLNLKTCNTDSRNTFALWVDYTPFDSQFFCYR